MKKENALNCYVMCTNVGYKASETTRKSDVFCVPLTNAMLIFEETKDGLNAYAIMIFGGTCKYLIDKNSERVAISDLHASSIEEFILKATIRNLCYSV